MGVKRFYCELCEEWVSHDAPTDSVHEGILAGMDHFRVLHPSIYEEISVWPDGAPVVIDNTLEPDSFGDPPTSQPVPPT